MQVLIAFNIVRNIVLDQKIELTLNRVIPDLCSINLQITLSYFIFILVKQWCVVNTIQVSFWKDLDIYDHFNGYLANILYSFLVNYFVVGVEVVCKSLKCKRFSQFIFKKVAIKRNMGNLLTIFCFHIHCQIYASFIMIYLHFF